MKTLTSRLAATFTSVALLFGTAAHADPLVIATGEYAPMTGEALPNYGVVNGLISRIAEKAGVEIEFEFMAWNRGLKLTRQGQKNAASYWNTLPDQTGLIAVGPVSNGRVVFFYRKDKPLPEWTSFNDLSGYTFGATLGYNYSEAFWAAGEDGTIKIQTAQNDLANFKKLMAGRIDGFVINELVGWDMLNAEFSSEEISNIAVTTTTVNEVTGYLQVSTEMEGGAAVASKLQAAYDALKASGELDQLNTELRASAGIPAS